MKTFQKSAVALATLVTFGGAQAAGWEVISGVNIHYGDGFTRVDPVVTTGPFTYDDNSGRYLLNVPGDDGEWAHFEKDGKYYFIDTETLRAGNAYVYIVTQTKTISYRGRSTEVTYDSPEELASKTAEFERSVDKQVKRLTKEAVVGAVVINVIADEFVNPALKDEGVTAGATVGGGRDNPEVHIGVSKDLGDGVSGNVGVGTSSGNLSVGVSKHADLNDHVRVGIGASYSDAGWAVGPSVQFHDGQGNGVGVSGVIPTITVAGYTVAVVPQLFVPNLVVIGARALYNWVKTDK